MRALHPFAFFAKAWGFDAADLAYLLIPSLKTRIHPLHITPIACLSIRRTTNNMKTKTIFFAAVLCFFATLAFAADNPNMGTWKLNEAKTKMPAGLPKNNTVTYEAAGDSIKVTVDGVDGAGKPTHNEWTGKFDGKDYPLTGDPSADSRSYTKINERTLALANKKGGKVTTSGRIVVSRDGKTRTLEVTGTDSAGKKVSSKTVYDKQ